jgi:hypothetical protein
MYWQASIAIVSVAAWLQMGQVVMDCLSIHRVEPRHGLANCPHNAATAFFRP